MLFQLQIQGVKSFDPLEAAIRARDPFASISLDAESGRIRVAGQLDAAQVLETFRSAGFEAEQVIDLGGGQGGCCGGCSGG